MGEFIKVQHQFTSFWRSILKDKYIFLEVCGIWKHHTRSVLRIEPGSFTAELPSPFYFETVS